MVGYRENDTMTSQQKLMAACIAGCSTRFIAQPMDVLKLRVQLQKRLKSKHLMYHTAKRIYREEGITAFWHGHVLGQAHSILFMGAQFYIFELTTKYTGHIFTKEQRPLQNFLCGVFSGCCSTAIVLPIEVVRVRQMVLKEQYRSFWLGAKEVFKHGGLLAFYEGFSASLLMVGPATGITFLVFTTVQRHILSYHQWFPKYEGPDRKVGMEYKPHHLLIASVIAASVAGFISKTVTYPLDLAKKRLQIGSHQTDKSLNIPSQSLNLRKCHSLFKCLHNAYYYAGLRGLYSGWTVTMWKTQTTMVLSFTFYELVCHAIRASNIS